MITDLKNIAPLVEQQFPEFYKEEGSNFIQFVKAYYEWMDKQGPIAKTRNLLEISDVDTANGYIDYFFSKYMEGIPKNILSNKALLEKHIISVYRSKGSIEGLKLLFRLLYNIEIDVYIPQDDVMMLSDGKWSRKKYLEVEPRDLNYTYDNKLITGSTTGATAYVLSVAKINPQYDPSHILYISDITPGPGGDSFKPGEYVLYDGLDIRQATIIRGSVVGAIVESSDENHATGDVLFTQNTSGSGLKFEVKDILDPEKALGYIQFKIIDGGYGYALDSVVTVTKKFASEGSGASFRVGQISNTSLFTYNTNLIDPEANTIIAPANTNFNGNSAVFGNGGSITSINLTYSGSGYVANAQGNITDSGYQWTGYVRGITASNGAVQSLILTPIPATLSSNPILSFTTPSNTIFNGNTAVTGGPSTGLSTDANSTINVAIIAANGFNAAAFTANDRIKYTVVSGNTAIGGLSNNTIYYVQFANTTKIALSATPGGSRITLTPSTRAGIESSGNYLSGLQATGTITVNMTVNNTITVANANTFTIGKGVKYTALNGNTAIGGLSNNTLYYIQFSNNTVIALSTTVGGQRITLVPSSTGGTQATGHYLQANAQFSANLNTGTIDSVLGNCLSDTTMEIGKIKSLRGITSGDHKYNGSVLPNVFEKRIWGYNIVDNKGGLWGNNAVITGELAAGNGVIYDVSLLSSGYNFNTPDEELEFINESNNECTAVLTMIVDGVATEEGEWLDNSGFLNSDKYITDSDFYQEFSYEIKVEKSLDKYIDVITKLTHPVGNKMFGEPLIIDKNSFNQSILVETITVT
jgi:hypothetical protein